MTAGQHKGMMLLTLLKNAMRDIKAIVYVDDNVRHVGAVFSAATARNIEISSFQYQREDVRVQRFQYGDKAEMDAQWAAVKNGGKVVSVAKPQSIELAPKIDPGPKKTFSISRPRRRCCRCR
jgi:hypothetical protein